MRCTSSDNKAPTTLTNPISDHNYQSPVSLFPAEEWVKEAPQNMGIDTSILGDALQFLHLHRKDDGLEEVMVVRHGRLVWAGDSIKKVHDIWSCTKSFVATAAGQLIEEEKISLDQPVAKIEPLLNEKYPTVTFRHFLTMTSGYNAQGQSRWGELSEDWSATPFQPASPLFPAGTAFAYWDEAMIMLGRALTQAAGSSLENYLAENLISPIGITNWSWWSEEKLADGTPINFGGTGIKMVAQDHARFGLLYLNDGRWNGQRILPEGWVKQATINQVDRTIAIGKTDRKSTDGRGIYGFNWWVINKVDGVSPVDAFYTSGLNHNVCLVIPDWDMVIVRMGTDGNPDFGKHRLYSELLKKLDPGINK